MPAEALCSWQVHACLSGLWERGQTKQHPGPPGWGFGARSALSPGKTRLATETPTRQLQEIRYLGEEVSPVRRRMKSSGESLRHLEATGRNHLSLSKDTTIGTWNALTLLQSARAVLVVAEMQRYNIALV